MHRLIVAVCLLVLTMHFPPAVAAECMTASWYGTEPGNRTATCEHHTGKAMTAAMPNHKYLGRKYKVTYVPTGKSVVVRINDIGPVTRTRRGIDISEAAARRIGMHHDGVGKVCIVRMK